VTPGTGHRAGREIFSAKMLRDWLSWLFNSYVTILGAFFYCQVVFICSSAFFHGFNLKHSPGRVEKDCKLLSKMCSKWLDSLDLAIERDTLSPFWHDSSSNSISKSTNVLHPAISDLRDMVHSR
jgi:hypothetical protein